MAGRQPQGLRQANGLHEELDPFPRQLAGPVQMAEEGQVLVLGQFGEVPGRKIRLPGLLMESHPQEGEKDQGQEADRTALPPEQGQGEPESGPARQQPGFRQV